MGGGPTLLGPSSHYEDVLRKQIRTLNIEPKSEKKAKREIGTISKLFVQHDDKIFKDIMHVDKIH